jgi:predicted DNA-binding transcriptional regulator AlpA
VESPFLRTEPAAKFLGVSPRTLEKWRRQGIGPEWVRLGARLVLYDVRKLEAELAAKAKAA